MKLGPICYVCHGPREKRDRMVCDGCRKRFPEVRRADDAYSLARRAFISSALPAIQISDRERSAADSRSSS